MNYWLMVVIFAGIDVNGYQEAYVFKDPHFHTLNECVSAANDPERIPEFAYKLVQEYSRPMDIQKIVCASQEEVIKTFGAQYCVGDPA